MSIGKLSFLAILIAIGGVTAGWGFWYGPVAAIGAVIVLVGNELIEAIKEQTAWLKDEEPTYEINNTLNLAELPSDRAATAIFGETN